MSDARRALPWHVGSGVLGSPSVAKQENDHRQTLVTCTSIAPPVLPVAPGTACLVVIYGTELGRRIALGTGAIECGRAIQTDIPLDDEAVSRRHARISWNGMGYVVRDLGST